MDAVIYDARFLRRGSDVMTVSCTQCNALSSSEDMSYDERQAQYFCNVDCFRDWADEHFEVITEFYERMNVE